MSSALAAYDRHLRFDGCFNFRDLGGYSTRARARIRWRRLFRADGPHALSDRDREVLAALQLATVLDLRTPSEATERGHYHQTVPIARTHHLPLLDVLPEQSDLSAWIEPAIVAARYREMLEQGRESIAEALAVMTDPFAYPLLFHCSAGKDRTGVLAALVLSVLDVPDDAIIGDYVLSRKAMLRLVGHFEATYPDSAARLRRLAPALVAAEPAAMEQFIAGVRTDYGSFDGFVEELGVGSALPYVRAALLSP